MEQKGFENYSETNWAIDFLVKAQDKLAAMGSGALIEFRGLLDVNNIQEDEAEGFLEAYKKGKRAMDEFLEKRKPVSIEKEGTITLPQQKPEEQEQKEKAA